MLLAKGEKTEDTEFQGSYYREKHVQICVGRKEAQTPNLCRY